MGRDGAHRSEEYGLKAALLGRVAICTELLLKLELKDSIRTFRLLKSFKFPPNP